MLAAIVQLPIPKRKSYLVAECRTECVPGYGSVVSIRARLLPNGKKESARRGVYAYDLGGTRADPGGGGGRACHRSRVGVADSCIARPGTGMLSVDEERPS